MFEICCRIFCYGMASGTIFCYVMASSISTMLLSAALLLHLLSGSMADWSGCYVCANSAGRRQCMLESQSDLYVGIVQALWLFLTCTATAAATALAGSNAVQGLLWRMGAYSILIPMLTYVFAPISQVAVPSSCVSHLLALRPQTPITSCWDWSCKL